MTATLTASQASASKDGDGSQQVQVIPPGRPVSGLWEPVQGEETTRLLSRLAHLQPVEATSLVIEAKNILSRCPDPRGPDGATTGLCIGYVQSGKTQNFTTVAALARDNGYRIIIVITGVTKLLFTQSTTRLREELQVASRNWKWNLFENPTPRERADIESTLRDWEDPRRAEEEDRAAVLITVMKNAARLRRLNQLVAGMNLHGVPVLVIDDEADQAGLNTAVNEGEGARSATYSQLLQLRSHLPHHAHLQYTATPQAPLLINLIDLFSPRFAELISPGAKYTGGQTFFVKEAARLIRPIPFNEIPGADNPLSAPPPSLLEAQRTFYLGVAAMLRLPPEQRRARSMMIHPSQYIFRQADYGSWVTNIQTTWATLLNRPEDDPDRQDLLREFRSAYQDLKGTAPELPLFEELVEKLARAVDKTCIWQMNTAQGATPQVAWNRSTSHILVGGEVLNRGFTVEGLTVTYMPRGIGAGQADTIQQRARFLGYKLPYLGFCRVYLEPAAAAAYQAYVVHEEDIHDQMEEHSKTNKPLTEWKRRFFLSSALSPTRDAVINIPYVRGNFTRGRWFEPKAPHDPLEAIGENQDVVKSFLEKLEARGFRFQPDEATRKVSGEPRHEIAKGVPARLVLDELLVPLRYGRPDDSLAHTGLLLQIERFLRKNPDPTCNIYKINMGLPRRRETKGKPGQERLEELFEGPDVPRYEGDSKLRSETEMTVQIHWLNPYVKNPEPGQLAQYDNVPAIAVNLPASMGQDWIAQPQGN